MTKEEAFEFSNKVVKEFSKNLKREEYINEKGCPIMGINPDTNVRYETIIDAFWTIIEAI